MSDPNLSTQRQIQALHDTLERLRKADVPALYLPWAQSTLNPFPLASSGGVWGNQAQPWAATVLAFSCTVFVLTTNDASNFWTVVLRDSAVTTIASFTTAGIAANTLVRFTVTNIVQPLSSSPVLQIVPTATLSPGAIIIVPAVALLKTGN